VPEGRSPGGLKAVRACVDRLGVSRVCRLPGPCVPRRAAGTRQPFLKESTMQSNAVEYAHLESASKESPAGAAALGWQGDRADFLHQSHRVAERAACCLMGTTLTTLAMYNLALWLMR